MIKRLLLSLLPVLVVGGASFGFTLLEHARAAPGGWWGAAFFGLTLGVCHVCALGFVIVILSDMVTACVVAWWEWVRGDDA